MTRDETKSFMKRIKQHYQEFTIDNYKLEEWHRELKKYDFEDVNKKFEEHLQNETYGRDIPKIYFLTKYIKTIEEKEKAKQTIAKTRCFLCGKEMMNSEFDKHFDRCSSVDYFIRKYKQIYGEELEREKLMKMSDEAFDRNYEKLLNQVMKTSTDENEIKRIIYIFNPPKEPVDISKLIKINKEEQ